ncbi:MULTISPECIES: hypothetical protein [unclassified Paraflavitalea]|uniref:hypothetical protein n=1 Tax=unclassified Paraflavitalea TaxID=2798305 RepID=UPI003D32C00E
MHLIAIHSKWYTLVDNSMKELGRIVYTDDSLTNAAIRTSIVMEIACIEHGHWEIRDEAKKVRGSIKIHRTNAMRIKQTGQRKPYLFQKTSGWNTRFEVMGAENEELVGYVPRINWETQTHDLILHLNEDFAAICQPLLILQGLHCTLVALSMMNGGKVPIQLNV